MKTFKQNSYRPLPKCLTVKSSKIDGLGLHATEFIEAGTNLGSIGGDYIYGKAQKMLSSKGLIPLGIAEDSVVNKTIKKGDPLSIEDVDAQDNELCEYWLHQNQIIDSD